jgi:predicted lipoprotein with Yx(FWY)xxD motif
MDTHVSFNLFVKPIRLFSLLAIMAIILAACAPAATALPTPSATTGAAIDLTTDPTLGPLLVDSNGMTLYVLTKDSPDTSTCNAACQANWPPLVSSTPPKAGPGVDASLIGLAAFQNGKKIVTYDHRPLYYKTTDKKAGDKTGEDVNKVWFVISPSGQPVQPAGSTNATAAPASTATVPTLMVATDPKLGQILVDENGMTLYAFTKDRPDQSNCTGSCLTNWPPLLTTGTPKLGAGVDDALVSSALLADGSRIVTYNDMPLYRFAKDTKPGDTNGEGVLGLWYAVSPSGEMVKPSTSAAPTAAPAAAMTEPTLMTSMNSALGQILVDGKGMTLYAYTKDAPDQSNCTGGCLTYWPPLLTLGSPVVGSGVEASLIGSAVLADGSKIVTYNHMPLYYFAKDTKPGDVSGQGVAGTWFVVSASGQMIGK